MATLISSLQNIAGQIKPSVLVDSGVVIVPFDALNSTTQDLIRTYVQPFTYNSLAKTLLSIRTTLPANRVSTLNVFAPKSYKSFLQMISKEDYTENRDRHKTELMRILYSEVQGINPQTLPLLQNTASGRKLFERIERSPYSIFDHDAVHYVEMHSTYVERGVTTRLCEFNIYLPPKYFMGSL